MQNKRYKRFKKKKKLPNNTYNEMNKTTRVVYGRFHYCTLYHLTMGSSYVRGCYRYYVSYAHVRFAHSPNSNSFSLPKITFLSSSTKLVYIPATVA